MDDVRNEVVWFDRGIVHRAEQLAEMAARLVASVRSDGYINSEGEFSFVAPQIARECARLVEVRKRVDAVRVIADATKRPTCCSTEVL